MMVVGNKVDLEAEREVPTQRPIQEFKENFDIECYEVSAKTGHNIDRLFSDMIASNFTLIKKL
jgi:GTPase SAR1 family protein